MSDDNITPFPRPATVGDGTELVPDEMLEANKGKFVHLVLVGFDADGSIGVCSSHGSREALWLLERGKLHLLLETE